MSHFSKSAKLILASSVTDLHRTPVVEPRMVFHFALRKVVSEIRANFERERPLELRKSSPPKTVILRTLLYKHSVNLDVV